MKKLFVFFVMFCSHSILGQTEWHVKPYSNNYVNPPLADGQSLATAWCLQYALSGGLNGTQVKAGDIIWLHGDQKSTYAGTPSINAQYKGHFESTIKGEPDKYITVSSYPGEWAVIDGNIHNGMTGGQWGPIVPNPPLPSGISEYFILYARKGNVRFENFEITCLGNFSRVKEGRTIPGTNPPIVCANTNPPAYDFREYVGIQHWATDEENAIRNEFRNLVIRNIPGIAFASWKYTKDTEIYGNIFYNNGLIRVIGEGCTPPLENVLLTESNTAGHQTMIYTQNASDTLNRRNIRNNLFLNGHDSGVGIWSAGNATDIVQSFSVTKNIFINNGGPVRDETANMIVHSNAGTLRDINIDSNIFYINSDDSYVSGILVNNVDYINITNNLIFNGTTGVEFGQTNRWVNFHHNLYAGKFMRIKATIAHYNNPASKWNMNHNTYYTRPGNSFNMFRVPNLTNTNTRDLPLAQVENSPDLPFFRKSTEYNDEHNSSRTAFTLSDYPLPRTIISQNKYNPNLFYVSVYNPQQSTSSVFVNFSNFNVPHNKSYRLRDAQNYFVTSTSLYNSATGISLPVLNETSSIELQLPIPNNTNYGPAYITPIEHSRIDFNTFVIEFECPGLAYELRRENITDSSTLNLEARKRIIFGQNYTSQPSANITATAENEIRLIQNTWIRKDSKFHGRINKNLCSLDLNETMEQQSLNANPGNVQPSPLMVPADPPFVESRIKVATDEGLLKLYPNPTNGIFNIVNDTSKKIIKVLVNRIESGKIVLSEEYVFQENFTIDISAEDIGLFSVQILFEDNTSKVLKIAKK